jgi:GMP reductase
MIKYIKENFPKSYLIAGNVATYEGAFALYSWGADCVKAGIGTGNVCITRNKTGFFRPIVSTLFDCCGNKNLPIIGDGGISEHQDVAKGIACGAHMVMAGSMFSGFDQSAGSLVEIDGKKYKEYYGNASEFTKMKKQNVEGKKILVPYKGNMDDMLSEMTEDLQSSISYSGGKDLTSLRFYNAFNIRFVRN